MRDQEICDLYNQGVPQREIATRFNLSSVWVGHILRKAGIETNPRRGVSRTSRTALTGVLLSPIEKAAVRLAADREKTSMSGWIAHLVAITLADDIKALSTDAEISPFLKEEDVKLPYDIPPNSDI